MLLGPGRAALARQQATLTLRFSLPFLPPSASQLQHAPSAVFTGIRYRTTKASATTTKAKKTAAPAPKKKAATPSKKAATGSKKAAPVATKKSTVTKTVTKATRSGSAGKALSEKTDKLRRNSLVASKGARGKAEELRQKERAKKAAALEKQKVKKAAEAQKAKEKRAAALERARQKKSAEREKQKIRKQSQRALARERARKEREKLRLKIQAQKKREKEKTKKEKEIKESKSLRGVLRTYLEPSLVKVQPPSPSKNGGSAILSYAAFTKEAFGNKTATNLADARQKYNALSESEKQKYTDIGMKNREVKKKTYYDWINNIPGHDVIVANAARAKIRAAYKKDGKYIPSRFKPIEDPRMPKPAPNAYALFFGRRCHEDSAPGPVTARSKAIGAEWSGMSDAQKAPFFAEAAKLKANYTKALAAYASKAV